MGRKPSLKELLKNSDPEEIDDLLDSEEHCPSTRMSAPADRSGKKYERAKIEKQRSAQRAEARERKCHQPSED